MKSKFCGETIVECYDEGMVKICTEEPEIVMGVNVRHYIPHNCRVDKVSQNNRTTQTRGKK